MNVKFFIILLFIPGITTAQVSIPQIKIFDVKSEASLRGLAAVSASACWSSGSEGTVLRTIDSGESWQDVSPSGYHSLQFRDIHAFNNDTALILSAGLPAVILKTVDGGQSWKEVYRNENKGVFFDAIDFWNDRRGMAFSDAIERKLLIISTNDGGESWREIPASSLPDVHPGQGGFAASGSCLRTVAGGKVIIGLGGPEASLLLSEDYGKSWMKTTAPLDSGSASKGIFSFDFISEEEGFCVGGDYRADSLSRRTIAKTKDGGRSWQLVSSTNISNTYRSCICYLNRDSVFAVSRTGISYSGDAGKSWFLMNESFYTCSRGKDGSLWFSGPEGRTGKLMPVRSKHN